MTAGRPARQPDPMTVQQVTVRTRQLGLLASGWLQAAEEDNEQVGSSRLDRPLSWLAVATAVVAFAFFAGTLILRALIAGRGHDPADHQVWSQALVGAAVAVPGALIAARRPRHPIGWLLLLAAVWLTVPAFGYEYARYTFEVHPGALPGGDWWLWASRREGAMADYALPFFLLLFPTGYLLSRRWRPVAWLIFAAITAVNVVYALLAGDIVPPASHGNPVFYGVRNPVGLFGDAQHDWPWLSTPLGALGTLAILLGLAGGIARFRRSRGEERQQLKWVAYALAVLAIVIIHGAVTHWYTLQAVLHAVAGVGFAAAVTIAVLKYRLYDIDIIINRTLVYLPLSGIIAGGYIAIVTGISAVVPHHTLAVELLAAGLAAVVFAPLRARLQALVNRVMYGERDDPYAALSRLADRLDATLTPDEVLPTIVDSVTSALRSPYAAIEVTDGNGPPRTAAANGTLPTGAVPLRVPLTASGAHVGDLVVAPPPAHRNLQRCRPAPASRPGPPRRCRRPRGRPDHPTPAVPGAAGHRPGRRTAAHPPRPARRPRPRPGRDRHATRRRPPAHALRPGHGRPAAAAPAGTNPGGDHRHPPPGLRTAPPGAGRPRADRRPRPARRVLLHPRRATGQHRHRPRPARPARRGRGRRLPDRHRSGHQRRPARRGPHRHRHTDRRRGRTACRSHRRRARHQPH